jgi:DNA-directed RNA polymerase specialized sigma24 family protein
MALTGFFHRRVYDRAEEEDLTQEVFVRLARHRDDDVRQRLQPYGPVPTPCEHEN